MTRAIADRILDTLDLAKADIEIPEWGFDKENPLTVRELTGAERDRLTDMYFKCQVPDPANPGQRMQMVPPQYKATVVQMSCLNGTGEQLFKPEHIERLRDKSAQVLDKISERVAMLSGMQGLRIIPSEVECPECGTVFEPGSAIEQAKENLGSGPNKGSGSDLL